MVYLAPVAQISVVARLTNRDLEPLCAATVAGVWGSNEGEGEMVF